MSANGLTVRVPKLAGLATSDSKLYLILKDMVTRLDEQFAQCLVASDIITLHNDLDGRSDADVHPATAITNTPSGAITATTVQAALNDLESRMPISGTYTPTLTAIANITSVGSYVCHYTRVGSVVYVAGRVAIAITTASTLTTLDIELPIASNLAITGDAVGSACTPSTIGPNYGPITANTTNDRARYEFLADANSSGVWTTFNFSYLIK